VTIAHGALNNWGQYAFKYMKDSVTPDAVNTDILALGAGFLVLLAVGVVLLFSGFGTAGRPARDGIAFTNQVVG
jgi:hypothetical protein